VTARGIRYKSSKRGEEKRKISWWSVREEDGHVALIKDLLSSKSVGASTFLDQGQYFSLADRTRLGLSTTD